MDTHPETKLLIEGEETPIDELDFDLYQKTKPAEAVQINEPFQVVTLEGTFDAKAGDYLMRGPAGELYSCDQTIFDDTYGEYHLGGVDGIVNNYTSLTGVRGFPSVDEFMWILWIIALAIVAAAVSLLIWHAIDQTAKTSIEKQKTHRVTAVACSYDESPRVCIERTQ